MKLSRTTLLKYLLFFGLLIIGYASFFVLNLIFGGPHYIVIKLQSNTRGELEANYGNYRPEVGNDVVIVRSKGNQLMFGNLEYPPGMQTLRVIDPDGKLIPFHRGYRKALLEFYEADAFYIVHPRDERYPLFFRGSSTELEKWMQKRRIN